jgi:hypothetical protein
MTNRATQRAAILGLLNGAKGDWVSLLEIRNCACQYNSRIFELRRLGYRITNKIREVDRVRRSWFRLEAGPSTPETAGTKAAQIEPSRSLFGDLAKESYGVD